jgi:uncharacterized protein
MKILMTGTSGLIGSHLLSCFKERGHEVVRVVRHESQLSDDTILWDPKHRELRLEEFEGFDVVVNLAGENISSGRWTDEKKQKIRDSRVIGTHMLAELLVRLQNPPQLFISASAVGFYGDRGEERLTETSPEGEGFLSEVCQKWEEATLPAKNAGIRVVNLRFGIVLASEGGALARMLLPFKMGLGGVIGTGKQYMSWIAIDDLVGIVLHVMNDPSIQGPVNTVSPDPVTNYTFTKVLGRVLSRPTIFPLPAFIARLILGEMADELLLSSVRAVPEVLHKTGYSFLYPDLKSALRHVLGRK